MHRITRRPPLRMKHSLYQQQNDKNENEQLTHAATPLIYEPSKIPESTIIPKDPTEILQKLEAAHFWLTDAGCAHLLTKLFENWDHGALFFSWIYAFLQEKHNAGVDALGATMLLFIREMSVHQNKHKDNTAFTPISDLALIQKNTQIVDYRREKSQVTELFYFPINLIGPFYRQDNAHWKGVFLDNALASASQVQEYGYQTKWASVITLIVHVLHLYRLKQLIPSSGEKFPELSDLMIENCLQTLSKEVCCDGVKQVFLLLVQYASVFLLEKLLKHWLTEKSRCVSIGEILLSLCSNVYFDSTIVTRTFPEIFERYHACLIMLLRHEWPTMAGDIRDVLNIQRGNLFIRKYVKNYRSTLLREVYDTLNKVKGLFDAFPRPFLVSLLQGPCRDLRYYYLSNPGKPCPEKNTTLWQQTLSNALILLRSDPGTFKIIITQGQELYNSVKHFTKTKMKREFNTFKREVWRELSLLIMRGHRKHMYNVLFNLCNTSELFHEVLLGLLHFCSLGFSRDFAQKYLEKHPNKIVLNPRIMKLLSHPEYRLIQPQYFWWKCHCQATTNHVTLESALDDVNLDETNLKNTLAFLISHRQKDGCSKDFERIFSDIDTFSVFESAINPGSATKCWHCSGYTCQCGRTYPSAALSARCIACDRQSSWFIEASQADIWYCKVCSVPVKGKRCSTCRGHDARYFWECSRCKHQNPNETLGPSYCLQCGKLKNNETLKDIRLIPCLKCSSFHLVNKNQNVSIRHTDCSFLPTSACESVLYFTWKCGCGEQNSPFKLACTSCGSNAFRCMWCFTKQHLHSTCQQTNNKMELLGDSSIDLVSRNFCNTCRMPHPRVWAMYLSFVPWSYGHKSPVQNEVIHPHSLTCSLSEWSIIHRAARKTCFRAPNTRLVYILPFRMRMLTLHRRTIEKKSHMFDISYWTCCICLVVNPWRENICRRCKCLRREAVEKFFYTPWGSKLSQNIHVSNKETSDSLMLDVCAEHNQRASMCIDNVISILK